MCCSEDRSEGSYCWEDGVRYEDCCLDENKKNENIKGNDIREKNDSSSIVKRNVDHFWGYDYYLYGSKKESWQDCGRVSFYVGGGCEFSVSPWYLLTMWRQQLTSDENVVPTAKRFDLCSTSLVQKKTSPKITITRQRVPLQNGMRWVDVPRTAQRPERSITSGVDTVDAWTMFVKRRRRRFHPSNDSTQAFYDGCCFFRTRWVDIVAIGSKQRYRECCHIGVSVFGYWIFLISRVLSYRSFRF